MHGRWTVLYEHRGGLLRGHSDTHAAARDLGVLVSSGEALPLRSRALVQGQVRQDQGPRSVHGAQDHGPDGLCGDGGQLWHGQVRAGLQESGVAHRSAARQEQGRVQDAPVHMQVHARRVRQHTRAVRSDRLR